MQDIQLCDTDLTGGGGGGGGGSGVKLMGFVIPITFKVLNVKLKEIFRILQICSACRQLDFHPSPFVFYVIYGYCMTFGETASPDKSLFFSETIPLLLNECLWYNELLQVSN